MSSSDEFYFFPRTKLDPNTLGRVDALSEERVRDDTAFCKEMLRALDGLGAGAIDTDSRIDAAILKRQLTNFIREFDILAMHRRAPSLYLKTVLLAIEQLTEKREYVREIRDHFTELLISRLRGATALLVSGTRLIAEPPLFYKLEALELIEALEGYFAALGTTASASTPAQGEIEKEITRLQRAMGAFREAVAVAGGAGEYIAEPWLLEDIFRNEFLFELSPDEVFDEALAAYRKTLDEMEGIAGEAGMKARWNTLLSGHVPQTATPQALIDLYGGQVRGLRDFVKGNALIEISRERPLIIRQTPFYMTPFRSSASYSCPLTDYEDEPGIFFISFQETDHSKDVGCAIHQEYLFVTAHETWPGHHFLDTTRKALTNPLRAESESCIFYEGWAAYAESLIAGSGYVRDPVQQLIALRRECWRMIRCLFDIGMRTGRYTIDDCRKELVFLGYPDKMIDKMIRHYLITYGYQSSYFAGKMMIERLWRRFEDRMHKREFHRHLLACGEAPFALLAKKIEEESE
ncbi:MAG: DUF885 family protein [Candidatus Omnitrophica bacterium]|nr:DUF885 family protein [Candidatus Omnitrophota bacterium]